MSDEQQTQQQNQQQNQQQQQGVDSHQHRLTGSSLSSVTGSGGSKPPAQISSSSIETLGGGILESGDMGTATTPPSAPAVAAAQQTQHQTQTFLHQFVQPPSGNSTASILPTANTVPEFLYQLTKMLTDTVNRDVIEWSNGSIKVHNPTKLQNNILNKYFRHSKFASFQRQLNYFGFRKLAGKGKMAPCSYVNDATTNDLSSLLTVKRKQPGGGHQNQSHQQTSAIPSPGGTKRNAAGEAIVHPVLAGIVRHPIGRSSPPLATSSAPATPPTTQQALARVAVGRGIRHGYTGATPAPVSLPVASPPASAPSTPASIPAPSPAPTASAVQASLSALEENYQSSLQQSTSTSAIPTPDQQQSQSQQEQQEQREQYPLGYIPGTLRRDDSLVDLAMIPMGDVSDTHDNFDGVDGGLTFIDFPWQQQDGGADDGNNNGNATLFGTDPSSKT